MKKSIGIIGCGSIGSSLLKQFEHSYILDADKENEKYLIKTTQAEKFDINKISILFICVRPNQVADVMKNIEIPEHIHLISTVACVTINDLEQYFNGKITKIIPSVLQNGCCLIHNNSKINRNDISILNNLLNFWELKYIEENEFEIGADVTSCAPGFIACIFNEYLKAIKNHSNNNWKQELILTFKKTIEELESADPEELIKRVATKGGITQEGVNVLKNELSSIFDKMLESTLSKHDVIKKQLKGQF